MDSVREKITIELARSKIRTEEIYAIIKQIADHIEPPTPAPVAKPAPAPAQHQHQHQRQRQNQRQHQHQNRLQRKLLHQLKRPQLKRPQLKNLNKSKTFVA